MHSDDEGDGPEEKQDQEKDEEKDFKKVQKKDQGNSSQPKLIVTGDNDLKMRDAIENEKMSNDYDDQKVQQKIKREELDKLTVFRVPDPHVIKVDRTVNMINGMRVLQKFQKNRDYRMYLVQDNQGKKHTLLVFYHSKA